MKYRINKKWTPHAVITAVAMDVVITPVERTRGEAVECAGAPVAKKASRRDTKEAREDWRSDEQDGMQRRTATRKQRLDNEKKERAEQEFDGSREYTGRQRVDGWRKAVVHTANTNCQRTKERSCHKETGTAASDDEAERERVGA